MQASKRKQFWGSTPKNKISSNKNRFKDLENLEDDDNYNEGETQREFKTIIVDSSYGFLTVHK